MTDTVQTPDRTIAEGLDRRLEIAEYIQKHTSTAALCELVAEEAAELAHDASKAARILRGEVPTPNTQEEAYEKMVEEFTDVRVAAFVLGLYMNQEIADAKYERWMRRLKAKEEKE